MVNNKIKGDMHLDFREFLIKLQTDRVMEGMESVNGKVSLWRLTKTIVNMIDANPELYKLLKEVKI